MLQQTAKFLVFIYCKQSQLKNRNAYAIIKYIACVAGADIKPANIKLSRPVPPPHHHHHHQFGACQQAKKRTPTFISKRRRTRKNFSYIQCRLKTIWRGQNQYGDKKSYHVTLRVTSLSQSNQFILRRRFSQKHYRQQTNHRREICNVSNEAPTDVTEISLKQARKQVIIKKSTQESYS